MLQTYLVLIKKMQVFLAILIALMYIFAIVGEWLFVAKIGHTEGTKIKTLEYDCARDDLIFVQNKSFHSPR